MKRTTRRHNLRNLLAAAMCVAAVACIPPQVPPPLEFYNAYQVPAQPPNDRSAVRVNVSLGEQRAYVLEGDRLLMVMPVTVGGAENPTPEGEFKVTRKIEHHRSPTHGFAVRGDELRRARVGEVPAGWRFVGMPLPYWVEIRPGVGFHTGWIRHQPSSQGTIRMHRNVAPVFFSMVEIGTPVSVAYAQPQDAAHAFIPLPPDSGPLPDYSLEFYLGKGFFGPPGDADH